MIEEEDTDLSYDERRRCWINTVWGLITLYFLNNSIHNLRVVIYQMEESTKKSLDHIAMSGLLTKGWWCSESWISKTKGISSTCIIKHLKIYT